MKKVTVIVFIGFIGIVGLLLLLLPKQVYSDDENRYLTGLPEFSFEQVKSGAWMEEFEQFVNDQFPARLEWIALKTKLDLMLGKVESNGVYITDEGYYIESFKQYEKDQLKKNVAALNRFAQQMDEQLGLPVQVMLVPTAAGILREQLPLFAIDLDQRREIAELGTESFKLIDISDALAEQADEYIYYKTDHHWTSLGAYYGYKAWKPDAMPLADYEEEVLSETFLGTLYSKVKVEPAKKDTMLSYTVPGLAQQVEYNLDGVVHETFFELEFLDRKDKYSVYFNGNQSVTRIVGAREKKKLLIIKDSYANTFAQFATADYAEVHMVDLRSFNMPVSQYVQMMGIDEVLVLYNYKNFTEDTHLYMLR